MAIGNKKQKKLNRFVRSAEDRFRMLMIELTIQYFVLFCVILSWDRIAKILLLHHSPGISTMQWLGAGVCLVQAIRYGRRVKRG